MTKKTYQWSVKDGSRRIEFDGDLIADVSSRNASTPRWTEMRLYVAESGVFVLEKVGRSIVVHAPECPEILPDAELPRFQEMFPGRDPADGNFWFCDTCGSVAAKNLPAMLIETDRHWASILDSVGEVVEAVYRKRGGARTMPRIGMELLQMAAAHSEVLRDEYTVTTI